MIHRTARLGTTFRPARRYRIVALDVDGTLLDRDGVLRPSTIAALARAQAEGIRPILYTGRRFRRALPLAEQLGLDAPLVCNSGAIVKQPTGRQTLWRADFDATLLADAFALFREHDQPFVSFTDLPQNEPDFLIEFERTGRRHFDDYLDRNQGHAAVVGRGEASAERLGPSHFHVCAIGTRAEMLTFEAAVVERLGGRVQTFVQKSPRYSGTMCELIRSDANKWTALLHVAELWGVDPSQIIAIGDDVNDLPMIAGAGLGVAMGHAPASVQAAAHLVTGSHDDDGVAMLLDQILVDQNDAPRA